MLTVLPCAPLNAQTLQDAVRRAITSHPKILAGKEEQIVYEMRTKQAFAGYLPEINISAGHGEEWTSSSTTRALAAEGGIGLRRSEVGLTVSQMLFDGMDTKHKVDQAKARYRSNVSTHKNDQESLVMEVVGVYLDTLMERELLELQKKNLQRHHIILSKVREMEEIGAGTKVDVRQSESRLALIESEMENSIGKKLDAQTRYLNTVGNFAEELTRPILRQSLLPKSMDSAIEIALSNHPSLEVSTADMEAAQAERNSVRAKFFPTISLELGLSSTSNVSGSQSYTKNASAMVELNYNLFRGQADVAKKWETEKNVTKLWDKLSETKLNVVKKVETAWHALQTNRDRIRHIEKYVSINKGVTQSYHDQFTLGLRPIMDVLDAEGELHSAKQNLVAEQFKLVRSTFQLLSSMGVLGEILTQDEKDVIQPMPSNDDILIVNNLLLDPLLDENNHPKATSKDGPAQDLVMAIMAAIPDEESAQNRVLAKPAEEHPERTIQPKAAAEPSSLEINRQEDDQVVIIDMLEYMVKTTTKPDDQAPDMFDYLDQIPEEPPKPTPKPRARLGNSNQNLMEDIGDLDYIVLMTSQG